MVHSPNDTAKASDVSLGIMEQSRNLAHGHGMGGVFLSDVQWKLKTPKPVESGHGNSQK
jgi:hypothetical protein